MRHRRNCANRNRVRSDCNNRIGMTLREPGDWKFLALNRRREVWQLVRDFVCAKRDDKTSHRILVERGSLRLELNMLLVECRAGFAIGNPLAY